MLIESIETVDGQSVELGEINVLFGPNNTGKTQTLRDILSTIGESQNQNGTTIIDEIEYAVPNKLEEWTENIATEFGTGSNRLEITELPPRLNRRTQNSTISTHQWEQQLRRSFEQERYQDVIDKIGGAKIFFLDAESRLSAAAKSKHQDVGETPSSLIQLVYNDEEKTKIGKLQDAFRYVFDKDIAIEYSGSQLQFYIADEFDSLPNHPIERYSVLKQYDKLDTQGGGFRSFAGVILSLLVSEDRVVLIDEPRAFLHPAQARKMGNWIAENLDDLPGQIIIATHDADFISGLLISEAELAMYRLSRSNNKTVYRQISTALTKELSTDPILSSQPVIDSLFHRGVVICEGDEDRSVYRSVIVNEFGRDDYLFIHTYGKGKMDDVVGALNESSVPAAAVLDVDVLKTAGEMKNILRSTGMDDHLVNGFVEMAKEIDDSIRAMDDGWKKVKQQGISAIPKEDKAKELIENVRKNGIFIVPAGELESWMDLSLGDRTWIAAALEEISKGNYGERDLRQFCARMDKYLAEKYIRLSGDELI